MAARIIALIGPPGSGKTTMAGATAVRRPVHFMDIDRKVRAMANLHKMIETGDITSWDIGETIGSGSMAARLKEIAAKKAPQKEPQGWVNFCNANDRLEKDTAALAAGTIVLDSTTQLQEHLKNHIGYTNGKSKLDWDMWAAYASMWAETATIMIDWCIEKDKDLIWTFHEKYGEEPGENTRSVIVTQQGDMKQRTYQGSMDIKIASTIQGAFGRHFGTYFTEVYALRVDVDKDGKPTWVCRVQPDGRRDLRTSFPVDKAEFPPDFGIIWGTKKPSLAEVAASQKK